MTDATAPLPAPGGAHGPMDPARMRRSADLACRLMKALSNPDRLLLMCQLTDGEKRVGELEALVGVAQPTLSQQLAVLREEGLVATRRDGKNIYYQVASPQALALMRTLFEQFCAPGDEHSQEEPPHAD